MAHPLFARLERQLVLVRAELANALEADRRFRALRAAGGGRLYHECSHGASLADGVAAICSGLESVLESLANEVDGYVPRGEGSHAALVDAMSAALPGVRPAVLSERTRALMHEARRLRHVVRHRYALELRLGDVRRNLALARRLVPAFNRDFRHFVARMDRAARPTSRRRKKEGR